MAETDHLFGGLLAASAILIGAFGAIRGHIFHDEIVKIVKKFREITSDESDGGRNITICEAEELVHIVVDDYAGEKHD